MIKQVLSRYVASISDLKKNPMETVSHAQGEPVAILNRNTPAFYCIPAEKKKKMLDILEDQDLVKLAMERENDPVVKVSIDDLRTRIQQQSPERV